MDVEAVLLTGGASRRMGSDKASLSVGTTTLAERTLAEFDRVHVPVTVLGRTPIEGRSFLPDAEDYAGPALALARFAPSHASVFVCSCDLPNFNADIVSAFIPLISGHEAALPAVGGRPQYLCALYTSAALARLKQMVENLQVRSMQRFVETLDARLVDEDELESLGVSPLSVVGAITPQEMRQALKGSDGRPA